MPLRYCARKRALVIVPPWKAVAIRALKVLTEVLRMLQSTPVANIARAPGTVYSTWSTSLARGAHNSLAITRNRNRTITGFLEEFNDLNQIVVLLEGEESEDEELVV